MSKTIYCAGCQTVIRVVSDDDPHRTDVTVFCRECTLKKARGVAGISNDGVASKRGQARLRLQALLPRGGEIAALQVSRSLHTNGYSVFEFYLFAVHAGRIVLLTSHLRELGGFGVNRRRGTLRTSEPIDRVISLLAVRLHGDPDALTRVDIDPAF